MGRPAIRRLAGQAAHDINTHLASVLGNLDLLAEELAKARSGDAVQLAELDEMIEDARSAGRRVSTTVTELTLLSRIDDVRDDHSDAATLGQVLVDLLLGSALANLDGERARDELRITTRVERGCLLIEARGADAGAEGAFVCRVRLPVASLASPRTGREP